MKKYIPVLFIISFICIVACTHSPQIAIVPQTKSTPGITDTNKVIVTDTTDLIPDSTVCFERDVLPIFTSSCGISGCHNASSAEKGYIFTNYTTIRARGIVVGSATGSEVYLECQGGKMPKSPVAKLTSAQLTLIRNWINAGAKDDTNCAIQCDTTNFTYSKAIAPLLSQNCYSCHSTTAAAIEGGDFILDNYNSLLIQVKNSNLQGGVQHLTGYNAMPLGGNILEYCQITQINKWIAAGSLNN